MKGCTFPSMSLTPGSACSPSSPEVSSGQQYTLCATNRVVLQEGTVCWIWAHACVR